MACTSTCIQPSPSNAHCGACHVTYGSVTGFDRHRRNGECLNPADLAMHAGRNGVWRMDGTRPFPGEPAVTSAAPARLTSGETP